ncbi:unnamed protein product [Caenorhabditis angaria]|uniref:Uncharacterized protein n=1 Tax=Caenorhabditis angaria TaxID=860376 RepID=A0A9P1I8T0_9PELO|nr:unnamed protein product [Caenorhabditis angaria]
MEREYEKRLENNEEKFAKQIVDFERICRKKDEEIEGLHNQLERFEGIQIALEQSEKNQLIDQEHRERLEIEVKMLYKKMDELGEEKTQYCAKLKNERDSLEQSVTHLKKQLETTPDSLAEVTKLRKTLKDMERKSAKEKEKYQRALSEMKTALTIIEKQQRSTQNKIRENFGNVTF